jgi:hypothetical protein
LRAQSGIAPADLGRKASEMNDQQLLNSIGEALYGPQWIGDLSREIHVSDRSLRRWANASEKIPWGVWRDIFAQLKLRSDSLVSWQAILWDRVLIAATDVVLAESYDPKTQWYFEVHDPESGRHSCLDHKVFGTLAELRAEMKRNPGMIFRIRMPELVSRAERDEFESMNIQRMFA